MKKIVYIIIISSIFVFLSCEYDIIDSKPGESLDPVSNLDYSISDSKVTLSWTLPGSFPDDIIKPVSVFIRISSDGVSLGNKTIEDAPTNFSFPIESGKPYKFIVKIVGKVDADDPYISNLRYSPGVTVEI